MKNIRNYLIIGAILVSIPMYAQSEYKIKSEIGEIGRGLYEISPGVYEIGGTRTRDEHLAQKEVIKKEIISTVMGFRDSFLKGDIDNFLNYFSNEYYDYLINNYNARQKNVKLHIKSRKQMFENYKNETQNCKNSQKYGYDLCSFWKNRHEAIKNRVQIVFQTYDSKNSKYKIGGFAFAFVELDGNDRDHPNSIEFSFVRENGKFRIIYNLTDERPDINLCVFCYYEYGEEPVREMFKSILDVNK